MTPGERLRQTLRTETRNELARGGLDRKKIPKKLLEGLLPGRETPDFFFLTANEHHESWRRVHADVREIRDNCGFAYEGQGQVMNLSQFSGHGTVESGKNVTFWNNFSASTNWFW